MAQEKKPMGRFSRYQDFIAVISAAVGVAASVLALYSKVQTDKSAQEVATYKRQLEEQAHQRAERESRARFDEIAYNAVVRLLEASNASETVMEKRQRAAMALVLATASDGMRTALLEILQTSPAVNGAVRSDALKVAAVIADLGHAPSDTRLPASVPVRTTPEASGEPKDLTGYRVVLFHCQQPGRPSSWHALTANALRDQLSRDPALSSVRFEVKELPEVLNASPGYSIYSNQIRFNPQDDEERSSVALKRIIDATSAAASDKLQFERVPVKKRTPKYLSVFLCDRREAA